MPIDKDKLDEMLKAMAERKAELDEKENEDTKIKDLEEKIIKLEKIAVKNVEMLQGSNITVGKPDMYKGFNFKVQGIDAPEMLPSDEKTRDAVVKEVIDVFAQYSKNPAIKKAAMNEGDSGQGAEYVPELWFSTVIEKARLVSVALQDCRRFPITAGYVMNIPKQGTSATLTSAEEEAASTESEPGSADEQITAVRYGLWGKFSQELLDDAMIDIVSYITRDAVEAAGQKIDDLVFNGGTGFTGIMDNASNSVTFGANNDAVSYANMVSKNFFDAIYAVASVRRAGAKFYLNRALMPYIMNLKFGASDSPLMTFNPSSIAGWSHTEVETLDGTDSTSTPFILFASLLNYALGVRSMSSAIELNPYAGAEFKQHQVLYRYYLRMGGVPIFNDLFTVISTA